ncbi:MAG TPA: KGG domain-containing protein [Coleofasciculaceae cyanobacterium]|jgi:anti-sigma28 factor (negative regulator of flagellin synthesis)
MASKEETKGKQGFASMDEDKRKAAASKGGKTTQKDTSQEGSDTASKSSKVSSKSQATAEAEEEHGDSEQLDELLDAFEEGDLAAIDLDLATEMIEEWQETLSKSKESGLKEIGSSLKKLTKALSSGKAKAEDLAELLNHLGEQVDESANDADRGYKTKLHNLGRAFKKAAKSLEQEEG